MNPKSVTMTQLRRHLHRTLHDLQDNTPLTITHSGRPVAVMMTPAVYEQIQGMEPSSTWPDGYFEQTYGALADDPLTRPEQGEYEDRASPWLALTDHGHLSTMNTTCLTDSGERLRKE